jgi:diphthamide synthase subunit DPH2
MFAPYISSIKTLFIVPTDGHYYEIIEMLKKFKIIILAPTCFGSCRNHHQGAVLCLVKTVVQACA